MTTESFAAWSAANGFKCVGTNAYGTHRGYPFSVYSKDGRVATLTATFRIAKNLPAKAVRALGKSVPKSCSIMQPQTGMVNMVCAGREESLEENFRVGLDTVALALKEAGAVPPDTCPYCHKKDCDSLAAMGGGYVKAPDGTNAAMAGAMGGAAGAAIAMKATSQATGYVPVHRACAMENANATVAKAEKNMVTGSYLSGLLGALLGGLVGALPSVITVGFFNTYFSILYLLIPLCAFYGYRLLGGKQTKLAFWIIAAVCVLHTVFTVDQSVFYIQLVTQLHIWPSPLESIPYYYEMFTPGEIIIDLLYPTVWLVVGLVVTRSQIGRTAQHDIVDAGVALETLTSYSNNTGL